MKPADAGPRGQGQGGQGQGRRHQGRVLPQPARPGLLPQAALRRLPRRHGGRAGHGRRPGRGRHGRADADDGRPAGRPQGLRRAALREDEGHRREGRPRAQQAPWPPKACPTSSEHNGEMGTSLFTRCSRTKADRVRREVLDATR
ncbi:MAG: hypothetical protein MZU79_07435 [Anaerotruncus sp.]|nr:hypothetical protein [Anaerotruncus sp.]